MSDGKREHLHLLGLATWAEMTALIARLVAAVLRNKAEEVEAIRSQAHDVLDHHIDAKIASITAIREDVSREFDGK
jgi:hypothetical protein